jgi:serine O-acetyltransferase
MNRFSAASPDKWTSKMFEIVREDLRRFHDVGNVNGGQRYSECPVWRRRIKVLRIFWHNPSLKALIVYRLGRWLNNALRIPLYWPVIAILAPTYWMLSMYYRVAYDICLELSADIGPGLYIGHFGGIRIRDCRLGKNCAIQQEVRIGSTSGSARGPTIGSHVWIGAHSKIEGQFAVGDRATIAAGTNITSDVCAGCLMLGNPARMCRKNYDNSAFL